MIDNAGDPEAPPLEEFTREDAGAEWTLHHQLLYALVVGAGVAHTGEVGRLYKSVAPLVYHGTPETMVSSRRYRRKLLTDLRAAGAINACESPHGWVWIPAEDVASAFDNTGDPERE